MRVLVKKLKIYDFQIIFMNFTHIWIILIKKIKETNDLLKTQTLLKIIPKNLQKITMMKVKHVYKVQLLL